jgi:pimeloyl-ACP methyl ester carboxylesterase
VVQHVAFLAPERLSAMILMDTSPEHFAVDLGVMELACDIVTTEGMERLLVVQKELGNPLETPAARRLREERPGWVELQDAKLLQAAPDMYVAMARALATAPSRAERLAEVAVPTLVLVGELDSLLLEPSHRLASAIPGAELVVIPDAGHSPQVETPEAWFDEVTRFLS